MIAFACDCCGTTFLGSAGRAISLEFPVNTDDPDSLVWKPTRQLKGIRVVMNVTPYSADVTSRCSGLDLCEACLAGIAQTFAEVITGKAVSE